jgi:glycerate dehydrogenase
VKIVVLDGHALNPGDNPWDPVSTLGELTVFDVTAADQVVARAAEADIVITNKTPLRDEALQSLPRLRLIAVVATGYDNVDVGAATTRGIRVSNVPAYATDSVAQHVFALLLELCQHTAAHDAAVRAGEWRRQGQFSFWLEPPVELRGLVMGVIGYGRIGRRVAELAHAFGMSVSCATRTPIVPPSWGPFDFVSIDEVFSSADVVSLHCPLTPETERLVNATTLSLMKRTAILLNTSRGRLIDEEALWTALRTGTIAGAGLDTLSQEPPSDDHPLLSAPRCIITPHMAWASLAARRRLMLVTADTIRAFLEGRPLHLVG